jgi:hypothetical protein
MLCTAAPNPETTLLILYDIFTDEFEHSLKISFLHHRVVVRPVWELPERPLL